MMKKAMIPLIVVLIIGAWGNFIYSVVNTPKQWEALIAKGDEYCQQELYFNARTSYQQAEEIKSEYATRLKIAETYQQLGENESYISCIQKMIGDYPEKLELYEKVATEYDNQQLTQSLIQFLQKNIERMHQSPVLTTLYEKAERMYQVTVNQYGDIKFFSNGTMAVKINDYRVETEFGEDTETEEATVTYYDVWDLINEKGEKIFSKPYQEIAVAEDGNSCFVKKLDGEWCCVNTSNYMTARNEERQFDEIGPLSKEGVATAVLDGKYCMINQEMKVAEVDWDFAGNFSEGVNAVRKGNKWAIVTGETWGTVSEYPYEEVALNLKGNCCVNGNMVVKKNGKYQIVNQDLEPVSDNTYEQLKCFESEQPTVYMENGKAGFVNRYGHVYIEAQYEDALPFTNGYAAVKQDGLWGYINSDNEMIVEPQYLQALPITAAGIGFAQLDEQTWGTVTIYLLWYGQE